ncbi:hypothetical protein KJ707_02775 [Patescibacteria group bacterium]|nr:hypothetical protein [Patescibacteria group bacterium]
MPKDIKLDNWYQIDFKIVESARLTIQKIARLINSLKDSKLIDRWFYLYENTTIRLRFRTDRSEELKSAVYNFAKDLDLINVEGKLFEIYTESDDKFRNSATIETFANIMSELSELMLKRIERKNDFSSYDLVERLSHCIFNNVYGTDTELYFLLKRLGIPFNEDDNPEQTILDETIQIKLTSPTSIQMGSLKIPIKESNR